MKWSRIGRLSAYARAESHLVQQTSAGALVTVLGLVTAAALFTNELRESLRTVTTQTMSVDTDRGNFIRMSFNMTYPSLPCHVLSLDATDVSGTHTANGGFATNGEVHKMRLNAEGQTVGLGEYIPPQHFGFGFMLRRPREEVAALNAAAEAGEGCNLRGWLDLQRTQGNVHVLVHTEDFLQLAKTQDRIGKLLEEQMAHMQDGKPHSVRLSLDMTAINVSHTIHDISFGPPYPGLVNPLSGYERVVLAEAGTFKYFLKVVPTTYEPRRGPRLHTNQYSLTEYFTVVHKEEQQMPAVWFLYDFSPIHVTVQERRRSLAQLLVRLCAVVGGVFAVTGMLDRWVHRLVSALV